MDASKYRILEKVNAGGMAEIFKAEMETVPGFKKIVAIKRLKPILSKDYLNMFFDEARLSLYLQHANIVSVFDVGESGGHFFIVMEYIDGVNLRQVWEYKAIPLKVALYIVYHVLEALHYAHNLVHPQTGEPLGIVHRDVSPQNILLSPNGDIKLVDFGLAKTRISIEKSQPGQVKGKYSYLAPELLDGAEASPQSDVFSTGVVLWELLARRRLFKGENEVDTLKMLREAPIPPPSAINPEVPQELDAIVLKALERNPDDRYASALEFGERITDFLFSHGLSVRRQDVADIVKEVKGALGEGGSYSKSLSVLKDLVEEELASLVSVSDVHKNIPASGSGSQTASVRSSAEHSHVSSPDVTRKKRKKWSDHYQVIVDDGPSPWLVFLVGVLLFGGVGYLIWRFVWM